MRFVQPLAAAAVAAALAAPASAQDVSLDKVTYQGRLLDGGVPANGLYDFQFGTLYLPFVASFEQVEGVQVTDGLFSTLINRPTLAGNNRPGKNEFDPDTQAMTLDIFVKRAGAPNYTFLGTELITSAPYANFSEYSIEAGDAETLTFDDPATAASPDLQIGPTSFGPSITLNDDASTVFLLDTNGGASNEDAYLLASGAGGAFIFDGSSNDMTVAGTETVIRLRPNATGDPSVILPADGISPTETLAEAGVANVQADGVPISTSFWSNLAARSITVPTSGYVIAFASGNLQFLDDIFQQQVVYGVSRDPNSVPASATLSYTNRFRTSSQPQLGISASMSNHALFSVGPGTHTFYFNARSFTLPATGEGIQLTLLFVPTNYGAVVSNATAGSAPAPQMTAEYEAELMRVKAEADRRFAEQQAQIEALQEAIEQR